MREATLDLGGSEPHRSDGATNRPSIRSRGAHPVLSGIEASLRLSPPDQPLELAPARPHPAPELGRHGRVLFAVDLVPERRGTNVERLWTLMLRPLNPLKLLFESVYRRQIGVIL